MEILRVIIQVGVRSVLPLMMLALALSLDYRDIGQSLRQPVIRRGLLVGLIAVPLFSIAVVAVLPLRPVVAGVILLMAVAPGAPLMMIPLRRQECSMSTALTLCLLLTLAAIVTLPAALALLRAILPFEFYASSAEVLRNIAVPLLIPAMIGLLVRYWAPRVATKLAPIVVWLFKIIFVLLLLLILVRFLPQLPRLGLLDVLAMLLVTVGAALIGDVAGGRRPEDRALLATAAVYGNPAIVLYVAQVSYPKVNAAPVVVLYVLLRAFAQIPFKRWQRRHVAPPLDVTP